MRTIVLALVAGTLASGCSSSERVGVAREAALASNALASNALASNALASNALASNALTSNALASNALTADALTDPTARQLLTYVVGCALPAGAHLDLVVDGVSSRYDGELGLAPSWGASDGTCDSTCQAWVSGCLLARLDYLGEHVPISIRGSTPALASSPAEQQAYPHPEATYYGNVFQTPQRRFACLAPGQTSDTRVCGPSLEGCVVTVVGSCADACDSPASDGSFPNCRDLVRDVTGHFPAEAVTYPGAVTVFRP